MSIPSFIGMEMDDHSINGIYCHWNGHLSHNGKILLNYYYNKNKIKYLLSLGDISSLGPEIGSEQDWNNPNNNWTVAYYRDYKEHYNAGECYGDLSTALDRFNISEYNYVYLFINNEWKVVEPNFTSLQDLKNLI